MICQSRMGGHLSSLLLLALLVALLSATTTAYKPLSDSFLRAVPGPGPDFDIHNGALLAPILIPRVPGTQGSLKVQHHFVDFFQRELPKWTIEWQNSTAKTPATGSADVPFANIIFKREPPWTKVGQANLLTLVAHFDSKLTPEGFIGATDSAVPCAVLMHVARSIDKYLTQMHDEMVELGELGGSVPMDMGIQILLTDGEEAFQTWTATDSLYGARYASMALAPLVVRFALLMLMEFLSDRLQSRGRTNRRLRKPTSRTDWTKSASLCSSTSSVPPTQKSPPTSCPRTGHTKPWPR